MELTFPTGEQAMVCVFVTMDGDQRLVAVTTSAGPDGPSMLLLKNNEDAPEVRIYRKREDCDAAFLAEANMNAAQGYEFICHVLVPLPSVPRDDPVYYIEGDLWSTAVLGRSGTPGWMDQMLNVKHMKFPWDGGPS